jgi:hypothetical protein
MGAGSSVDKISPRIHISVPRNRDSYKHIIDNIQDQLKEIGIIVTCTDTSEEQNSIYRNIRNAHAVIMCYCSNSTSCVAQAMEYSYLVDNFKKTYHVIIDPHNHTFLIDLHNRLGHDAIAVTSPHDVGAVIKEINNNHITMGR